MLKQSASAGEFRRRPLLDPVQAKSGVVPDERFGLGDLRKGEPLGIDGRPPIDSPANTDQAVFAVPALEGAG